MDDLHPIACCHCFLGENAVELLKIELAGGLDEQTQDHFDGIVFDQRRLSFLEDLQCKIHQIDGVPSSGLYNLAFRVKPRKVKLRQSQDPLHFVQKSSLEQLLLMLKCILRSSHSYIHQIFDKLHQTFRLIRGWSFLKHTWKVFGLERDVLNHSQSALLHEDFLNVLIEIGQALRHHLG